jgi:hypothetical protein
MQEIMIAGEGLRLALGVGGYEQEAGSDEWDANWLRGSASIELLRPPFASFRGTCSVAWQTTELHAFHEGLRTLLDDLTGVATLATTEDQVELSIRLDGGNGTITGRVEAHAMASLEFDAATDQTYLRQTLSALRTVVSEYPFRE